MKRPVLLLIWSLTLTCSFVVAQDEASMPRLTNKEVVELTKVGLSEEIIVAKIKVSRCNFDTTPSVLAELKRGGVPDAVLKAMVEAPYGKPQIVAAPEPAPKTETAPTPIAQAERPTTINAALPTYGRIELLKGARRAYVISEDEEARKRIGKRLSETGGMAVSDSPEEADVFLEYGVLNREAFSDGQPFPIKERKVRAQMRAYVMREGRRVVVWSDTAERETEHFIGIKMLDTGRTESQLTNSFLKALKKARGGKL